MPVGVNADEIVHRIDDPDVIAEYERQRAEARSAFGTPAHAQDKTTMSDGLVRFTAPSVVFRRADQVAFAGGWQPLLAYDTLLANLAPELERTPPPASPEPLLEFFQGGLTTAEVAQLMAHGSDPLPDHEAAESMLRALPASHVARVLVGDDGVWRSAPS